MEFYFFQTYRPPNFGKDSPREVLATAVGNMLQEARLPDTEPFYIPIEHQQYENPIVKADLSDYLRVAIEHSEQYKRSRHEPAYSVPRTQWEIIHPELPIIKVTSYVETYLPLIRPGMKPENFAHGKHFDYNNKDAVPHFTRLAVSFVIAFQNRRTSFDDPNRWITRFQEDMQPIPEKGGINTDRARLYDPYTSEYVPRQGSLDPAEHLHFPNYWHPSDYMQHSIIGPVVMTVYESPVLKPGNYSQVPTVTYWEAPGPIIPTEQLIDTSVTVTYLRSDPKLYPTYNKLRLQPLTNTTNPGYPNARAQPDIHV